MAKVITEELMTFLRDNPKEAEGMMLQIDGRSFVQMFDCALQFLQQEWEKAQKPATMTTNEVIKYYHISRKYLYDLCQAGKLDKMNNGRTNVYYVDQLNGVLRRKVSKRTRV